MKKSLTPATYRVLVVLGLAVTLGLNMGCKRDPNKLKHRYLDSGKRYEEQGKLKEAAIQFSNALKVDRNFGDAHYELSKIYLKQGAMMQGYAELMRTVDLQPNFLGISILETSGLDVNRVHADTDEWDEIVTRIVGCRLASDVRSLDCDGHLSSRHHCSGVVRHRA